MHDASKSEFFFIISCGLEEISGGVWNFNDILLSSRRDWNCTITGAIEFSLKNI